MENYDSTSKISSVNDVRGFSAILSTSAKSTSIQTTDLMIMLLAKMEQKPFRRKNVISTIS